MDNLEQALENLKAAILSRPPKKQQILIDWLNKWAALLRKEDSFSPASLPYYKRGDVAYADFGFNVGAEYGGVHYAVVMEVDNNKANGNILVVPLTSHMPEQPIARNDVFLGNDVITWKEAGTVAKPNQIRAISKMRILKPVKAGDRMARLTGAQLQLIDNKLKEFLRLGA
jgi:mRNA-degrading endonuclease toxin of MazEF toxin-antitoxin module